MSDSQEHANTFGPLVGLRVVELGAIGPVPFTAGFLADMGADVIRVASPTPGTPLAEPPDALHLRGRASVQLNLRDETELRIARQLLDKADVLLEGFRPGTLERLGLEYLDCIQIHDPVNAAGYVRDINAIIISWSLVTATFGHTGAPGVCALDRAYLKRDAPRVG